MQSQEHCAKNFPSELHPFKQAINSGMDIPLMQTEIGDNLLQLQTTQKQYDDLKEGMKNLKHLRQSQMEAHQASASYRLGHAITWPMKVVADRLR
jgi:hypothetical protein